MQKLWTTIKHNQGIAISICICIPLLIWFYGCDPKVQSLINPTIQVTEGQLRIEYSAEIRRLENELEHLKETSNLRLEEIARINTFRESLYKTALTFAEAGSINPLAILSTLGSILGIGAVIDNRRKDILIKTLKPD